jgi:hypothetical protein
LRQSPKPRVHGESDSAEKLCRGEAFFAFELHFEEFQPSVSCAGNQQAMILDVNLAVAHGAG